MALLAAGSAPVDQYCLISQDWLIHAYRHSYPAAWLAGRGPYSGGGGGGKPPLFMLRKVWLVRAGRAGCGAAALPGRAAAEYAVTTDTPAGPQSAPLQRGM